MTLYLLRHARAGRRSAWPGDDDLRPLTKVGKRQATGVAALLRDAPVSAIVSSPSLRCRQSVEPLARHTHLPVVVATGLAEDAELHEALRVLEKVIDETAVLCTHGDVLELLLDELRRDGVDVGKRRGRPRMDKGSFWEVRTEHGQVTEARYHPPPDPPGT